MSLAIKRSCADADRSSFEISILVLLLGMVTNRFRLDADTEKDAKNLCFTLRHGQRKEVAEKGSFSKVLGIIISRRKSIATFTLTQNGVSHRHCRSDLLIRYLGEQLRSSQRAWLDEVKRARS